jgi:hypothetical protein
VLFPAGDLAAIRAGAIDLAFRRWKRPAVRPGARLRTAAGVIEILDVARIDLDAITGEEARRAGADRDALLARLAAFPTGDLYRLALRYAVEDPRAALREAVPTGDELAAILARLARVDAASRHGPWTTAVLSLIAANEGVRAAELATRLGRETLAFKADVRKLKELGLTESLEVGYRLSPRGRAVLGFISRNLSPLPNPA